jgi:hypothetical protein
MALLIGDIKPSSSILYPFCHSHHLDMTHMYIQHKIQLLLVLNTIILIIFWNVNITSSLVATTTNFTFKTPLGRGSMVVLPPRHPSRWFTSTSSAKFESTSTNIRMSSNSNGSAFKIDFQSDTTLYGRGDMHLSAALDEGDIVVYQTGTWEVDGVEVGDGSPACFNYCAVETIQLVWTHNCEHGFIQGMAVNVDADSSTVEIISPLNFIDFGPEQLVARLPVKWISDDEAELLVSLPSELQNS